MNKGGLLEGAVPGGYDIVRGVQGGQEDDERRPPPVGPLREGRLERGRLRPGTVSHPPRAHRRVAGIPPGYSNQGESLRSPRSAVSGESSSWSRWSPFSTRDT